MPCGISVIIGNNGYIWISPQKQDIVMEESKDDLENYDLQVGELISFFILKFVENCIEIKSGEFIKISKHL